MASRQEHWKKIAGLTFAFVACLLVGSGIFTVLETKVVKVSKVVPTRQWNEFAGYVKNASPEQLSNLTFAPQWKKIEPHCEYAEDAKTFLANWENNGNQEFDDMLNVVKLACGNSTSLTKEVEETIPWELMDALYFSMTVVTTIGFGHIAPKTAAGKIFCIVYALIGIPLTGLLLAALGDTFSTGLMYLYDRGFTFWRKGDDIPDDESADVDTRASADRNRHKLLFVALIYGLLGVTVLMSLPALIFTFIEGWTYYDSMYVSFVTLTTIGFGDLVPGGHQDNPALDAVYKVLVILWIVIGLAYWATVFTFISKGLRAIRLKTVNSQARIALRQLGFVQRNRDPKFVSENSKIAIELMMKLAQVMAAAGPDYESPILTLAMEMNGGVDSGTGTFEAASINAADATSGQEDVELRTGSISSRTDARSATTTENDGNNA